MARSTATSCTKMVVFASARTSLSKMKLMPVWRDSTSKTIFTFASRNCSVTGLLLRAFSTGTTLLGPLALSIFARSAAAADEPGSSASTARVRASACSSRPFFRSCSACARTAEWRRSA